MRHLGLWLELRRWRAAGRRACLWWRDDDAAGASPSLERLLGQSAAANVPLTLAVIPSGDIAALTWRLARAPLVRAAQHGVDHINRRLAREAGEFPHDWPVGEVTAALRGGWNRMAGLPRVLQVYVPPWNDAHPQLAAALLAAGYAGWSANGGLDGEAEDLPRLDVHLDLLRWRGGARFRGRGRFLGALAKELRRRRLAGRWGAPIGLLTHHLDHDPPSWAFLERFLAWSGREPTLQWIALADLLSPARARDAA